MVVVVMKANEQAFVEKTFPFRVYDREGKVVETLQIVAREMPAADISEITKKCTYVHDGVKMLNDEKQGYLIAANALVRAPFEKDDGTPWEKMTIPERVDFLRQLSTNNSVQIQKMLQDLVPELSQHEQNLS